MRTTSCRRTTLLLLLVAILAAPLASAAGPLTEDIPRVHAVEPAAADFFGRVWSFLRSVWSKTGCHLDPNGPCSDGMEHSPVQPKSNCHIDPNGLCVS